MTWSFPSNALIVSALLGFSLQAPAQAPAHSDPPAPARIVNRYALISSINVNGNDPKDWRLLGSNDKGVTWTTLDVRTNQQFKYRSQRKFFHVRNPGAYNAYRLQIDAVASPSAGPGSGTHLADLLMWGPMVKGPNDTNVEQILTSSLPHPLYGRPENAFDNDPVLSGSITG